MTGPTPLTVILIALGIIFIFVLSMTKLIRYIKTRRVNTELWCTIFEGFTQGAIRLDHLKNPESVIEVKIKRNGREKDSFIEGEQEFDTTGATDSKA